MTTQSKTKTNSTAATPEMDAWGMACAVLTALRKTEEKARNSYTAIREADPANPFVKGAGEALSLFEVLQDNRKRLEDDVYQHARSSGLTVPEWPRQ